MSWFYAALIFFGLCAVALFLVIFAYARALEREADQWVDDETFGDETPEFDEEWYRRHEQQ